MAKKRKRKKIRFAISGILLILLSIIGILHLKPLSNVINGFSALLVGEWYNFLLIIIGIAGIYLILKKTRPKFLTFRLIGLYVIISGVLVLSHLAYIDNFDASIKINYANIIRETFNNLNAFITETDYLKGGGILGAILSVSLINLLTAKGAKIISIVLIICGVFLFTGITILNFVKFFKKGTKGAINFKNRLKNIIATIRAVINPKNNKQNEEVASEIISVLENTLNDHGIEAKVIETHIGPTVTLYEMEIKAGTKLNRILNLDKELALALAAKSIRIQAPIPGKKTVGIEIPNKNSSLVGIREVLENIPTSIHCV